MAQITPLHSTPRWQEMLQTELISQSPSPQVWTCVLGNSGSSNDLLWEGAEMPGQKLSVHFPTLHFTPSRSESAGLFRPLLSGKQVPPNRSFPF